MNVGEELPALVRTLDVAALVAYAGATWDWYRTHYDLTAVTAAQLPAPIVDGQMLGALLAEHAQDWAGPRARVEEMDFRFRAMVFAGEIVTVTGAVRDVAEEGLVIIRQRITADHDKVAIEGATTVLRMPEPQP